MRMKSKITITVTAAILLALLYVVIFGFSGQDGEESGSLSLLISEKCAQIVNTLSGKHWTGQALDNMARYFEHPIRKLAHFSEYACMGILLYFIWSPWVRRGRRLFFLTAGWVFLSAAADELHQFFVPGRYCSFADVLLDTCGGIFGTGVCLLIFHMRGRRQYKKKKQR